MTFLQAQKSAEVYTKSAALATRISQIDRKMTGYDGLISEKNKKEPYEIDLGQSRMI